MTATSPPLIELAAVDSGAPLETRLSRLERRVALLEERDEQSRAVQRRIAADVVSFGDTVAGRLIGVERSLRAQAVRRRRARQRFLVLAAGVIVAGAAAAVLWLALTAGPRPRAAAAIRGPAAAADPGYVLYPANRPAAR